MEETKIKISAVVTALNEEKDVRQTVSAILDAFKDFEIAGEVVIINDGSSDNTGLYIEEMARSDKNIRVISHASSQGVGASFWDGVDAARGEVVVWFPGDNENNPAEIIRYHKLLEHVDIIIPFLFNKEVRSKLRNILSSVYTWIINVTFVVNFNYTNGTILYRRSILKELGYRSSGFFFQTDILVRVIKKGYIFSEVPYALNVRTYGLSKAITISSFKRVVCGYLRLVIDCYFKNDRSDGMTLASDSVTAQRRKQYSRGNAGGW